MLRDRFFLLMLLLFNLAVLYCTATPLVYRPIPQPANSLKWKRSNAELVNGLVGMDLAGLNAIGKRSNAELINGLIGMDLSRLSAIGRR